MNVTFRVDCFKWCLSRTLEKVFAHCWVISQTRGASECFRGLLFSLQQLQQVAARLDLGNDLDLDGVAVFESNHDAALATSTWREAARTTGRQPMVALLGLRSVFDGLSLTAEGNRVHARIHIPANQREGLAEKLLGLLRLIAGGRR